MLTDLLLYAHESFLPFLFYFYGQAYQSQHSAKLKEQMQGKFTDTVYKALIVSIVHTIIMKVTWLLVEAQKLSIGPIVGL